ncbi:methylthioribulose 1-phosphate dehydratase [Alkalicoccobacillus porphyridii]|uniref:Methylthioribulose-1-phosphate dehydratase n=1 Tax=Alkalicoccobacillus porphyridii TaxID=2597270 RepID=A0A553ZXK8_9BACI|nr:methylthioribulose 1-phosphate dehydratase [Alkalicoccobacillus porphyridii]TSB46182.1 methylthioribulose 1-phosphate dehydratase [Alkalicoccobacillus porphyridii]
MSALQATYQDKWDELADIKDELAARDWFPGTSGNLSIKVSENPLRFLVTASGKDKRKRTAEDFLLVNEHSQSIESTSLKPSAETVLHQRIYENTNAGCSLHVHTLSNNVISELYGDQGEITFQDQELIKAFNIWEENGSITVPIVRNYAELPRLAEAVAEQIRPGIYGVLIRNHGITAWGRNGFEAKKHLEAFEFLFAYHLKLKQFTV